MGGGEQSWIKDQYCVIWWKETVGWVFKKSESENKMRGSSWDFLLLHFLLVMKPLHVGHRNPRGKGNKEGQLHRTARKPIWSFNDVSREARSLQGPLRLKVHLQHWSKGPPAFARLWYICHLTGTFLSLGCSWNASVLHSCIWGNLQWGFPTAVSQTAGSAQTSCVCAAKHSA